MTKYLISFPSRAMQVSAAELPAVAQAAHAVMREARAAGVYVFGGGIDEAVMPVQVGADGGTAAAAYPETQALSGGFCVLELDTREAALQWAAKIAAACRCPQDVRAFMHDPES